MRGGRGRTTGGSANRGTQSSLQPGGGHTRRDSNRRDSGRHNGQEMTDSQVVGFLGRKIWQAMNDEDGDLSQVRQENFNYYTGQEYGTEREGYSKFVTRETTETIEWVLPSVLNVFLAGDQVVSFDPEGPDDEQQAKQETDITNYFVMRGNNNGEGSFLSFHHWLKDALMYPNGYLKVYMEEAEKTDVGVVTGVNAMAVQMLESDPDVTILEQRSRTEVIETPHPQAPGMQVQQPIEVFDLRIRTTKQQMQLRLMAVPPEECLVDNDCTSLNLDEADFVCHRVRKTYTQLVNEGYDPDELDNVGLGEDYQWNDERTNRLFYEDEDPDAEDEDDPSMRTFWVHECYAWFDYDGVGTAQQRQVVLIGDRVFENKETNYQPMIALSSILMQHKHTGMSFIDIVKDLQLLMSTLTRQLLDNVYKINVRRKVFSEDALLEDGSTMEALLNTQAEFIPVRGPAANAFVPEPTQSIVGELLPVIQHVDQQRATRTGISPEAQVDPNALQEVREQVAANALDRASQRVEMLVRIIAETGFRWAMKKVHQLLRSHWDIRKTVKLRGEWVDVDPQGWRDRTDMSVNVGLGFHPKNMQLQLLMQLLAVQKEAAGQGMSNGDKIYRTLEKVVAAAGLGDGKMYFTSPQDPEFQPPQPQPDPSMILAQAQAEALQREANRKDQETQLKYQTDQAKAQADVQKSQMDVAMKQAEMEIKRAELAMKDRELQLRELELQSEGQFKAAEVQASVENTQADTQLKLANADKAMADAASVAVEASDAYQQAVDVVSKGAEANDGAIEGQGDAEGGTSEETDSGEE